MDRRLTKDSGIVAGPGCESRGFIDALHCFNQPLSLFGIGQELQLERQLHYYGVYHSTKGKRKGYRHSADVLPLRRLKSAVSRTFL